MHANIIKHYCVRFDRDHTFGYGDDDLGTHFVPDFTSLELLVSSLWLGRLVTDDDGTLPLFGSFTPLCSFDTLTFFLG